MSTLKNEVAISKCVSTMLDDDTIALAAFVYHTRNKEDPEDKSFYRYEVRVAKLADIKAEIEQMKAPENRLKPWHWPNPTWNPDWYLGYDKHNDNAKGAAFLNSKIKKAMPWDQYVRQVRDGIKILGTGQSKDYPSAKYITDGYVDAAGNTNLSIIDKQTMLDHLNKPLWHIVKLKRG